MTGAGGLAAALPRTAQAGPLEVLNYQLTVPEIFAPLPDPPEHSPAIVIGTGFGGAVAALRLAQAGIQTTLLERGSRWPKDPQRAIFSGDTVPDGRGFWHRTSWTNSSGVQQSFDDFGGVLDLLQADGLNVYRGACVGGGSIVYSGVMIEPEQRFFEAVFQGRLDYASMRALYYPRVRALMQLSPIPDDIYNSTFFQHSRIWDQQVRRAGYTPQRVDTVFNWSVVRDEIAGRTRASAIVGESTFGNANGAKFDLTQNYLPLAEQTGRAKIYPGHQVRRIGRQADGRYVVQVDKIDPTGAVLAQRTLLTERLFLAAGSIGTTELLLRARGDGSLPNLSDEVGLGFGSNGDAAVVRSGSPGAFMQAAPCASRIVDESGPLPVSLENWWTAGVPDVGVISSVGMVADPTRGRLHLADDRIALQWPGNDRVIEAARPVNERIARANGVPTGLWPISPDVTANFTAHPLGGAVMDRVTDNFGRVTGYPGLYVIDGALLPGSCGTANPSLTIAALAERNIEAIISHAG
ncbi:MAG TPA: GMC oxidoreductase [Polyangiales bacterium]|nr:GMC oxidoreductase [Polyangiales bacterium]